jgi:hypothetical protein
VVFARAEEKRITFFAGLIGRATVTLEAVAGGSGNATVTLEKESPSSVAHMARQPQKATAIISFTETEIHSTIYFISK